MKRGYWKFLLLLWFTASMSIANAHIHHDLNEHEHCVKCFAHDHMGNADLPPAEAIVFDVFPASVPSITPTGANTYRYEAYIRSRAPPEKS